MKIKTDFITGEGEKSPFILKGNIELKIINALDFEMFFIIMEDSNIWYDDLNISDRLNLSLKEYQRILRKHGAKKKDFEMSFKNKENAISAISELKSILEKLIK